MNEAEDSAGDDRQPWAPLFVRDTAEAVEYEALSDGVPYWLERSLWRWVMDMSVRTPHLVFKAERALRIPLPHQQGAENVFSQYWDASGANERLALVDFFLHDLYADVFLADQRPGREVAAQALLYAANLDVVLSEGGSLWRVAFQPHWSLVRRVNETTHGLADLASSPDTDAARKIASAWRACYQHAPDYDRAYRDAVFAVEAVALPVVVPNNQRGTLGNVVSHIADTADRWTVGGLDDDRQASGDTLLAMLRTLWHNHRRHAQSDGTVPPVSQSEAESAVTLAVTLVHWFASGLVRRTDGESP